MQLLNTTTGLALPLALAFSPVADAQLVWRVSIKVVLDENDQRSSWGDLNTDGEIFGKIDAANAILSNNGPAHVPGTEERGYLFELVDLVDGGIMEIGDLPAPPGTVRACANNPAQYCTSNGNCPGSTCEAVAEWHDAPIKAEVRNALQAEAEANPTTYGWNDDAINIYILGSDGSGTAWWDDMVLLGQDLASLNTPFHEIGHFLRLYHSHGGGSASPSCTNPQDDDVEDTLLDICRGGCGHACSNCWCRDDIANANWPTHCSGGPCDYADLSSTNQHRVEQAYYNLMCYRGEREVLTPDQLDRMTDYSNGDAFHVASGRTRFVDDGAAGPGRGSSTAPFPTVAAGLAAADPGDIVLLRAGSYNEVMTIDQFVALRASRGDAVIGE